MSNCPEHGDLMRDFARGCFDEERSMWAETVRENCADCARWWNKTFSGEAYGAVEGAVTESIASFVPPARRRYRWLAAAAALVLAVGIGATSMLWRSPQTSPTDASEVLSTWDFEAAQRGRCGYGRSYGWERRSKRQAGRVRRRLRIRRPLQLVYQLLTRSSPNQLARNAETQSPGKTSHE